MDVHTKQQRSFNMSQIKSKDTKCESAFRKYIWAQGIRGYRKHVKLPGKPDIYFPRHRVAVFIDGCFWHKCPKCYVRPKTNKIFWDTKIEGNVQRDKKNLKTLQIRGIAVIRFWQHEIKNNPEKCFRKLEYLLKNSI